MYYFIIGGMMSAEKNFQENPGINKSLSSETFKEKKAVVHGMADWLYRLIEKDDGVPFRLAFGDKPGYGQYLYIGEGIRKLTGFELSNFNESAFSDLIEEIVPLSDNIPSDNQILRKLIWLGEIGEYRIEMRIRSNSGERKWIRETAVQYYESGMKRGLIGIYHDITEKKNYNILLEEAIKKASESERLKTTFLQNISHELRTPLNAIVGFSTLISEQGIDYGKKMEFARMINTSTDDLVSIMESIMEISRIEAGSEKVTVKEVKPSELLKKVYKIFYNKALESNILLECCIPPDSDFSIATDGYKLFQIIYHLTCNAIKFTPAGKVEFGYNMAGDSIEFYISDTGIGITEQDKPKIFNKFFQADSGSARRYPGTGLGLTIAKAYAGMLGGSLTFRSSRGAGSTFRFTLPYQG